MVEFIADFLLVKCTSFNEMSNKSAQMKCSLTTSNSLVHKIMSFTNLF